MIESDGTATRVRMLYDIETRQGKLTKGQVVDVLEYIRLTPHQQGFTGLRARDDHGVEYILPVGETEPLETPDAP